MPISRTAASCWGPKRSTVSGNPTSLLALPSLLSVSKRCDKTAAIASLVDVLAMLPVTPTTRGEKRWRQAAATAGRPNNVSGTATIATSAAAAAAATAERPASASLPSPTRSAAAPAARAALRKRWPSVDSPGRATKRAPGSTNRESTAAPLMGRRDERRTRPWVAEAISATVRASGPAPGPVSLWRVSVTASVSHSRSRLVQDWAIASPQRLGFLAAGSHRADRVGRDLKRYGSVGGHPTEQFRRLNRQRQDALADLCWLALVDHHADRKVWLVVAKPAIEAVVVDVIDPSPLAVIKAGVPDLCRAGLAANVVARDVGRLVIRLHGRYHVLHQPDKRCRQARADHLLGRRGRCCGVADRSEVGNMRRDLISAVGHFRVGLDDLDRGNCHALAE